MMAYRLIHRIVLKGRSAKPRTTKANQHGAIKKNGMP